jgi:hypothetical protein
LIVSSGWQTRASIIPAPPPATRFVNGEAGFFCPGPLMLFADMVMLERLSKMVRMRE